MEIMKLTIKEDFHCGTHYFFCSLSTKSHYFERNILTLFHMGSLDYTHMGGGGRFFPPPITQSFQKVWIDLKFGMLK